MLKLSVVTVCYNAEKDIEKTMKSVLGQSYKNIEYLIIDGKSSDRTLEIIKKYQDKYDWMYLISEKDTGIYNAMNKGISKAKGDYIYFLNSGDCFSDLDTVERVMCEIGKSKPDLFYGDIDVDYGTHTKRLSYVRYGRLKKFWIALGVTVCHQAVFASGAVLKQNRFDETFKLWADQEWMMRLLKKKAVIESKSIPVCIYDGFGQSSSAANLELIFEESDRITKKYAPIIYIWSKPFKCILRWHHRKNANRDKR